MYLEFVSGDLQVSIRQTVVLPVSGDGKVEDDYYRPLLRRYPIMAARMETFCRQGVLKPGKLWLYRHSAFRNILVLPTCEVPGKDLDVCGVSTALRKVFDSYAERGITSLAIPRLSDDREVQAGFEVILESMDIPVDVYCELAPLSQKIFSFIHELCEPLSEEQEREIREKICFEQ